MAGSNLVYPNSAQATDFGSSAIDIDFREMLRFVRRRLPIVIGCIIVTTALAIIITSQMERRFTAVSQIMIDPPRNSLVEFEQNVERGIVADASFIGSQIKILTSRTLIERLVEKLNLVDDPEFNPSLRKKPSIFQTFFRFINPMNWIPKKKIVDSGGGGGGLVDKQKAIFNMVVDVTRGAIQAERDGLSHIIRISATSKSPRRAAELANTVMNLYMVDELEWRAQNVKRTNAWLDDELADLREKLTASESALEYYKAENDLIDVAGSTITDEQRGRINAQLVLARAELVEKESRFRRVQGLRSRGTSETAGEILNSPIIGQLKAQQANLIRQRANLAAKYGDRHPTLLNLQAEIGDLNAQIRIESNRVIANIENEMDVVRSRVISLENSLRQLDVRASENEQARIKMKELQREADANQELYNSLLSGFKKSSILSSQGTMQPFARELSAATTPGGPSFPRVKMIVAVAFFGGAALGLLIAFLAEALDDGISTSEEVETQLTVPHLASIPMLTKREYIAKRGEKKIHDYLLDKPLSEFTEAFRHLRSAFALLNVDHPPKVILVSSSLPHEGKTTVSLCLARSAASAGHRTLLIDADLRNPSVSARTKNQEIEMGLVEVLAGRCELDDILIKDQATPLDILPTVAMISTSSDVLNSQAMGQLIEDARDEYDLIILDSAPTLLVADTTNLCRHVDACAFVVQWDATPKRAAMNAIKKLRSTGVPYVGVVLSQVDVRRLKSYGKGDDAYYMSKYSVYYADS